MVRSPPKAPYINSGSPTRPPGSKYSSRSYMPGRDERDFYAREDEYGNQYPPYTGPLGTYQPGYVFDPRSRTPTTQNASFSTGFAAGLGSAYQNYVAKYYGPGVTSHNDPLARARAATGAVAEGLKTGAGWLGHAAAGLLGAPQGPSTSRAPANTGGGIGSDVGAVSGITPTNRLYGGNPGTGAGVSAYNPGSTRQGMDGVLDLISQADGTTERGYNEVLGYGAYGRPSKPLTEMTLQDLHDFGRGTMFSKQREKGIPENKLSSAAGRYQITGDNIKAYATKWGLDMKTTKFTPQLQDRIAIDLATNTPKGLANWEGFKYGDGKKLKQQAAALLQGKPVSALAYTSTDQAQTPAQRAAAAQAAGTSGSTSNVTDRGEHIAAMQRDLNSRGAKLTVDGLEGPITRQAEQQFYGSPTSVRTPSFTNRPTYTSGQQDQGTVPRTGVASTPSTNQPYTPAASTPRTPYYNNPYTNSTGGASYTSGRGDEGRGVNAPLSAQPRQVQAVDISGSPMPPRPFQPAETARIPTARPDIPGQNSYTSGRGDQGVVPRPGTPAYTSRANTVIPYSGRQDAGVIPRAGVAPPQTPYLNQPYMGPEWDVIPGLLQQPAPVQPTARIPQARPNYQPPQQAVPTLIERLDNLVQRAERALGGGRDSSAGSSRSGSGGSNYSGGNYGGQGGGRINEGVGGAYRNR